MNRSRKELERFVEALDQNEIDTIRELTAAKASGPGSFPWPTCIAKMTGRGYSMDVAKKICGSIKAKYGG